MKKQLTKHINKKRYGFTLVELLAVMAILGILAAITVPRFSHFISEAKDGTAQANAAQVTEAVRLAGYNKDLELESWSWVDLNYGPDWGEYRFNYSFLASDMDPGEWGFVKAEDLLPYLPDGFPIAYGPKLEPGQYSAHILCNEAYPGATTYIGGASIQADLGNDVTIAEGSKIVVVDYMAEDGKIYTMMYPKSPNTFWPFSSKNFFEGYLD